MPFFSKPTYSTISPVKKKDIPKDLYTRCPKSGELVYTKELEKNLMVVPKSGFHFPLDAATRIESLIDEGTWKEFDDELESKDLLKFKDTKAYADRLKTYKKKTGLNDAIVCGLGEMGGIPVSLSVMDFRFGGASMGSVVGEKIARAVERAIEESCPVIIVAASGGARMQEGIYSLMQMAKTSAALARLKQAGLPFISVLTNPTTGGVTASFATLGDLILAEPEALICFAGPRVIKEGTNEELPAGFQRTEFLLDRGLIDQIVPRGEMRERLIYFLSVLFLRKEIPSEEEAS
ncbi:acetyl-CoA carboxylase carboxyltransferase subunit beta [Puniceicoccales bacterium CK1056]|uniref:Acetyl-coenzyme A carboxylase carboxyl transferase subunit beta n=1 Tax=Oceanipulchritudo coccoides TaxID=2706888 RepID=A0A6B2LZ49_9BACT|nr:acetyl-CoA carboxylase, carboxyltransferase subunit beta [Oceanipulchritudo coccoides]NDV61713.1 acetyl-CoA carboxylase carboxyltransferase subunit beta [Oceanipulchritudo coccoides]